MALLLTAPGIPQLFMGQEFLEDKQWCPDPFILDLLVSDLAAAVLVVGGSVVDRAVDPLGSLHARTPPPWQPFRKSKPPGRFIPSSTESAAILDSLKRDGKLWPHGRSKWETGFLISK